MPWRTVWELFPKPCGFPLATREAAHSPSGFRLLHVSRGVGCGTEDRDPVSHLLPVSAPPLRSLWAESAVHAPLPAHPGLPGAPVSGSHRVEGRLHSPGRGSDLTVQVPARTPVSAACFPVCALRTPTDPRLPRRAGGAFAALVGRGVGVPSQKY